MDAKDIALIKALGGGGSGGSITVDSELSDTSTNPVQNKVIKAALDGKIQAPSAAEVGQTIIVKAVDENGKPTEWEAVDANYHLIKNLILEEEVSSVTIDSDNNGNAFHIKELLMLVRTVGGANNTSNSNYIFYPNSVNAAGIRLRVLLGLYAADKTVNSSVYAVSLGEGKYHLLSNTKADTFCNVPFGTYSIEGDISSFTIYAETEGFTFGIGTQIYVYGR